MLAADRDWLVEHRVNPWMGQRSLPLWLGGDHALWGFQDHRNDRAVTSGLRLRPMVDTLTDTLAWESARGEPRTAGLDDADHDELVHGRCPRTSRLGHDPRRERVAGLLAGPIFVVMMPSSTPQQWPQRRA